MALKINNLEHLDGKRVQYSTLTSQHPEIFVNRKRNTGELIITTDTNPKYGMHHIYAGGEHIAGGYGFNLTSVRDDLGYIQETYNGVFNFFNNAYYNQLEINDDLYTQINQTYFTLNEQIINNSYLNTSVNNDYNSFTVEDYSYILQFNNGELSVLPTSIGSITLKSKTGNTEYELLNILDTSKFTQAKINSTQDNLAIYLCPIKLEIYQNNNVNYKFFSSDNITKLSVTDTNNAIIDLNKIQIDNNKNTTNVVKSLLDIKTKVFDVLNNSTIKPYNKYIVDLKIPVYTPTNNNDEFQDISIDENNNQLMCLSYYYRNLITNLNTSASTNIFQFIWCYPIIYGVQSFNSDEQVFNIKDNKVVSFKYNDIKANYDKICNTKNVSTLLQRYTTDKTINNLKITTSDNKSFIWMLIPNCFYDLQINQIINFYLSTDLSKRGENEGGFYLLDVIDNYSLFISDDIYNSQTIRIDIDII